MPKTEPIRRDPWERWKGMALAAKERLGLTDEEIARRLASGTGLQCGPLRGAPMQGKGPSRQAVTRWRKNPETMPLWAFARMNRILEIEASAAREAVVVWR